MTTRRALHAAVSHEAHEQWHDLAGSLGVSVTAILEALASRLPSPNEANEAALRIDERLVHQARRIDAERRSRSRGRHRGRGTRGSSPGDP